MNKNNFNKVMKDIENDNIELNHISQPKEQKLECKEPIDLNKINIQDLNEDIRNGQNLNPTITNDKSNPIIPDHTKKLKNFQHQNLMDDIIKNKKN